MSTTRPDDPAMQDQPDEADIERATRRAQAQSPYRLAKPERDKDLFGFTDSEGQFELLPTADAHNALQIVALLNQAYEDGYTSGVCDAESMKASAMIQTATRTWFVAYEYNGNVGFAVEDVVLWEQRTNGGYDVTLHSGRVVVMEDDSFRRLQKALGVTHG